MTEEFEAALRLVLKDEVTQGLAMTTQASNTAASKTAKGWKGAFGTMEKHAQKAHKTIQRGQGQIRSGAITMAAGAAMAAPLVLAAKAAATFEEGMAEVATLTKQSATEITASFGPIVNATRKTFGVDAQNTIKALYDGFSAGVPKTKEAAAEYLKATGQMAQGGKTDMAAAADAITTVKNAWAFEGLSFKEIVDQTFSGVRDGKTTVTEMSASMGQAAATVAGARVKYHEFIGAIAALTLAGVKTPQAMTQISAAISAISKPSDEATKAFKRVRAEITPLTIEQRGLGGTFEYLTGKINAYTKDEEKRKSLINEMFGSLEALKAVTLLAGDSADKFAESTDNAANSTGAMSDAARKMTEGPMHDYRQSVQDTQVVWESFGRTVTPMFSDMLKMTQLIISDTTEWASENEDLVDTLTKAVLVVGGLTMAIGAAKIILGFTTMIKGATLAIWGMNAGLLANPVTWMALGMVAAVGAISIALYTLITRSEDVGLAFEYLGLSILKVFADIMLSINETIASIVEKVQSVTGIDIGVNVKENVQGTQDYSDELQGRMDAVLNQQRLTTERREELNAKKAGGGDAAAEAPLSIGGINIDLKLPNVPISQQDLDKLGIDIEKKTIDAMRKVAKQKSREAVSG